MKSHTILTIAVLVLMTVCNSFTFKANRWSFTAPKSTNAKHSDTLEISRYKGKIVVLNFWASWSKSSRSENKNLLRTYQVFKNNPKVVFASVSLDVDEKAWKTAIEEDEMVWKDHYCDFKKYQSPMALKYNVSTLPTFLVFDASGTQKLSAANSHDLEAKVKELLK